MAKENAPAVLTKVLWTRKLAGALLAIVLLMPSWNTPHPTSLRSATFSHKG
jgi:hypothetical protein